MGIQALPQSTVRAIGANQALTDPAAVVKELIDNALDARATSIAVEIHSNTLDVIQVKDNGHGIPPQDRPLVARRYCTSKITGTEDLRSIGGSSLGFRGEALASAAELSGGMTITTRVEGEQVATLLKISQQGEVVGQERASTPIGTTARVTDFIKANPVRRQVMLKKTEQCLKRTKQVLQSYAFARPHVRLSLRVLKAKNDKGNWMYAPKPGGNAEDAAFKIVGAACASQCTWSVLEAHGFTLQGFVPKVDAIADRISGTGPFLSVDTRPVSAQRGTPKQIVKIFREAMKKANPKLDVVKEPFLCLKIVCPDESYDANVEPAKDNVLFEDPEHLLEAARQLFSAAYPSSDPTQPTDDIAVAPTQTREEHIQPLPDDADDGFTTSLEHQPISHPFTVPKLGDQASAVRLSAPVEHGFPDMADDAVSDQEDQNQSRPSFRSNMYGCDEEDLEYLDARPPTGRTEADFGELRQAKNDVSISNPWVMAKLNARVRPSGSPQVPPIPDPHAQDTPAPVAPMAHVELSDAGLPTPRPSSPSRPFNPSDHVQDVRMAKDGRVIGPTTLPTGQLYASSSQVHGYTNEHATPDRMQARARPSYSYGVTPESDPPQGTPLSAIPQASRGGGGSPRKRQPNPTRLFVSPVVDGPQRERVWFDHLEGIEDRRKQRLKRSDYQQRHDGLVAQGELGDLIEDGCPLTPPHRNRDIRDFVDTMDLTADENVSDMIARRNFVSKPRTDQAERHAIQDNENTAPNSQGAISGRGFVPASEIAAMEARMGSLEKPAMPAPPPKRRKTGDRALRQISGNASPAAPAPVPEGADEDFRPDTAARTVSRRRSSAKVHRSKSSKLPLERTPAGKGTHDLSTVVSISPENFETRERHMESSLSLLPYNEPAIEPYNIFADEQSDAELGVMAEKLRELLINRVCDREVVQDLSDLVKEAFHDYGERMLQEPVDMSQVNAEVDERST